MLEFMNVESPESNANTAEFYLATVTSWSNSTGVKFQIDGQPAATQKAYKMMLMCRPLHTGARVVVMKMSGTYVVLGEISNPNSYQRLDDLASNASTTAIINKINAILAWMRTQGMLWTS